MLSYKYKLIIAKQVRNLDFNNKNAIFMQLFAFRKRLINIESKKEKRINYEKKEKKNIEVEIDMPVCTFKRKPSRKPLIEFEEEVGEEV